MKLILTIALIAIVNVAGAQDYCKLIKKEITDNNTSFTYESPYKEDSMPAIRVARNYSTNPDYEFDNFSLILAIPCEFSDLIGKTADGGEGEKEETKMVLEFDDKTKMVDDTLQITHNKKDDGTAQRIAYLPITPQNLKILSTKKIVKIHLATASLDVPADVANAIPQYVLCLNKVKK